jgi:hypothetical protein
VVRPSPWVPIFSLCLVTRWWHSVSLF